jgi:putative Holliday junction resolvase
MSKSDLRIMGLDFGGKTCGVAVTDALGITVTGVEVIRRNSPKKLRQTLARIVELSEEYEVSKIILGFPVNLDGSQGDRVEKTREFKELLEKRVDIPIEFHDERLTTVEAYEVMDENGVDKRSQREIVDMVAAEIILQSYLNDIRDKNRKISD